jgi:haloacetate dehalogenase
MARDQVAVMGHFGFDSFGVAGHDRGGRCAYRLALDHPDRITKLAVLDILPTYEHYRRVEQVFAHRYWHWFFLSQPFPVPETIIAGNPEFYFFRREWADHDRRPPFVTEEALADYLAAAADPATVHATCEDYRAAATIDSRLDQADLGHRRIGCPVLALWAARGLLPVLYDPLAVWSDWADDVRGEAISSGHYLAEEAPQDTTRALLDFFLAG